MQRGQPTPPPGPVPVMAPSSGRVMIAAPAEAFAAARAARSEQSPPGVAQFDRPRSVATSATGMGVAAAARGCHEDRYAEAGPDGGSTSTSPAMNRPNFVMGSTSFGPVLE